MDKFVITGGTPIKGRIFVGGAKNAAVAIIPAVILAGDVCRIENLPDISDVVVISAILEELGAVVKNLGGGVVEIDPRPINNYVADHELVKNMRASYYLLGALLGRFSKARVPLPGGCYFGVRPIDQHLKGFEALGATPKVENGMVSLNAESLTGSHIYLDVVSVGATINIMLAAVKARGLTIIENVAREPHIVDLANFLNSMGADIMGAGTDTIKIRGVEKLGGTTYSVIPDQIEAGSYMVAAAATGGDVIIDNVIPKHLETITAKLVEMGCTVEEMDDAVRVTRDKPLTRCNVKTMPHPGFPTDMQPQIGVLLAMAEGTSILTEGVWDSRFQYVGELCKMGAQVSVDGKAAIFEGVKQLTGAPVKATDLRGGAAVVIAAMAAQGESTIEDIYHIERGYEKIIEKLCSVGAKIERRSFPDR
ncbi:MAG: UDP-N-acetylglucosamine 1-carboxyvinyltransferase [Oscillospiraceae bacterium]|nr:UDP-N-acetylglucosamine 1-carboxyvinyltransferase [Oscillospiraceae bacterium]